ncbi:helix-turn-helix domain-containing protein [Mycobacteroides abscessus]|uniref:helix-turn-helix domain-containing protein n=1 Tax=Mycobacteroides abscessus TaxID=36809 RepID=UPI00266EBC13|nr:helix-turn-helix domain-containing protein [Mycobacteroides abscessus]MDO3110424.1 helix-turn-helix domain-containing protein [Mycobacteroides abscessus subsp. abscessus]
MQPAVTSANQQPALADRLLTMEQVAEAIHLSIRATRDHTYPGKVADPIPTVRIGKRRLVKQSELAAWIDRRAAA